MKIKLTSKEIEDALKSYVEQRFNLDTSDLIARYTYSVEEIEVELFKISESKIGSFVVNDYIM